MPNNQEMAQALLGRLAPPPEPAPTGQGFWQGFAQDALKYAPLALRAGGLGAAHRSPTTGQFIRNPAKGNAPIAAGAAAAGVGSGLIDWDKYADPIAAPNKIASAEMPVQPAAGGQSEVPMGSFADRFGGAAPGPSFDDRFGGMAPPSQPEMGAMRRLPESEMGAMRSLPVSAEAVGKPRQQVVRKATPQVVYKAPPQTKQASTGIDVSIVDFLKSLGLK